MALRDRIEYPVSAGGIVYRVAGDAVEVTICGRDAPDGWTWGLPKGTPEPGESLEETALREASEETGLRVVIEAPVGHIQYSFLRPEDGVRCHKTVHFYLMRPDGGSLEDHDAEFDAVRWVTGDEAMRTLTYKNETDILESALNMVPQQSERGSG